MNAQKGTAQAGRRPPALHERAIGLDERSLAQLIVSSARHAAGLAFVDAHGVHQGDWGELLARDESVLLARLACMDLDAAERDFLAAFEAQSLAVLAERLLRLWRKLDTPLQGLLALDTQQGGPLPQQLRAAQAQLRDELGGLHAALQAAGLALPVGDLHAGWRSEVPAEASALPLPLQLRQAFFSLRHVLQGLQRQAIAALPASLCSGRHEAAAGLLLAALQLFQRWQQEANGLHGRRIDFYYQQLLAQQPRAAARERVHLVLQRDAAEPLELPPGLDFSAGADAQGQAIRLRSEEPLCLGDAEVAALYTLRLLRDARISPECSFDFVSGASAQQLPLQGGGRAWPLLGASARGELGRDGSGAQSARIGLALASPLLKLQEGRRQIRLGLRLRLPESGLAPLCERALQAGRDGFARAMGRVFARWLLGEQDFAPGQLEALQQRAEELGLQPEARSLRTAGDPLSLFGGEPRPQRALMRDQLLRGLFQIELSAADGWLQLPAPNLQIAEPGLLQLLLQLPPSAPAIVGCDAELHGAQWPAGEAVLRLQIAPRVRIYPLSLFEGLRLQAIDLAVEVKDLRQLQLANQLGRLDAGKPCMPFGPLPDGASHLIVGAEELANKPVDALRLNLLWAGLPTEPGGFALHYADYQKGWRNDSFRVGAAVLRDGSWGETRDESQAATLPLFADDADERLLPAQRLSLPPRLLQQRWRPVPSLGTGYDTGSRGGYLRLRLREPEDGYFGHALYPQLLTEVLSDNAKPRWRGGGAGQPLPTPPYTPLLERLTLDYRASRRITLGQADLGAERLWYQRPFGLEPLLGRSQLPTLLPEPGADGHLLIGLRARALGGPLSLLFELDDSMAEEARVRALPEPGLHWSVWDEGRWQALPPSALLRDGTAGLLTSGVLVLDLPMLDASQDGDGSSMPQGLFWLRVASDAPSERFAGLRGVRAQAVPARLERPAPQPLPPGQLDGARAAVDGLRQVLQPLASTGHAPAEDVAAFRTRVAERLRHRQRACQPWDYERLVLAECPEVERALCLPGRGVVRVVLVPRVPRNVAALATQAFSLPVVVLERIEALLRPLASPFARIAVHSAGFERVQLRCHLHLRPGSVAGQLLQRAQAAVQQFLSPWFDGGLGPEFGWTLRGEDLEALLRALPGVRAVSGLSLLHYGRRRDGRHWLVDSARLPASGSSSSALLRPRDAGSLLLPADTQLIVCSGDTTAAVEHSGISHLGVGRNFIVGSA